MVLTVVHITSILVRMMGIRRMKTTQRMTATTGKGISSASSLPPDGSWRKIASKSSSPVVMVMVLRRERCTVENGERYNEDIIIIKMDSHLSYALFFRECTNDQHMQQ